MVSFHEIRLDKCYSYGAQGGPKFKTNILTLDGGDEKRNQNWQNSRGEWDISYAVRDLTEAESLRTFFFGRRGRVYGFRFHDAQDFKINRQQIGTTDGGTTTTFQAYKNYADTINPYTRNIYKFVDVGSEVSLPLAAWTGGVSRTVVTSGSPGASEVDINLNTGLVTLGATIGAAASDAVEIEGEFDVPVRFDRDDFDMTIVDSNIFNLGAVPLVEVRDIT